jgi:hypothetical protein
MALATPVCWNLEYMAFVVSLVASHFAKKNSAALCQLRSFMVYACHVLGFESSYSIWQRPLVFVKQVLMRSNFEIETCSFYWPWTSSKVLFRDHYNAAKWTCSYNLKCIQFTRQIWRWCKVIPRCLNFIEVFLFEPHAGKTFHPTPLSGSSAKCERKFLYRTLSNSVFIKYLIKEQAWKLSPSTMHHKNL